eukprot:351882-Chlamydomonas_euryale.AAC.17
MAAATKTDEAQRRLLVLLARRRKARRLVLARPLEHIVECVREVGRCCNDVALGDGVRLAVARGNVKRSARGTQHQDERRVHAQRLSDAVVQHRHFVVEHVEAELVAVLLHDLALLLDRLVP